MEKEIMNLSEQSKEVREHIIREKHALIPILMKEFNIDCWIIFVRETATNPDSIMRFTVGNDVVLESAFIFGFEGGSFRKVAIVANFDAMTQREKRWWDEVIGYELGISDHLKNIIDKLQPETIALNFSLNSFAADGLTHGLYLLLENYLKDHKEKFVSAEKLITALRGRKSKKEIELIKKACKITEDINRQVTETLQLGLSEVKIQELFYKEMEKRNLLPSWQKDQCPAVDAGPDKEFGHIGPQLTNKVKKGHTLHNDFGVYYQGYCSDIQRLWFFGKKKNVPEELRHALDTIVNAIQLAADTIKPGIVANKVDSKVREYILTQGYEEFKHALGHQVGIQAHDGGTILGPLWERYGDLPKGLIETNQVFTIEPSIKTKSYGMVSLEENVVVTKNGCEFLVPPQKDFIYIE